MVQEGGGCKDRAAERRAEDRKGNQNASLLQGQVPRGILPCSVLDNEVGTRTQQA